jgi:hypothetical protein
VAEDLREVEQISSGPKIVNCERVAEGVKTDSNADHAELLPQQFQIPKQVPLRQSPTLQRGKDQGGFMPRKPAVQYLAKFKRHGNDVRLSPRLTQTVKTQFAVRCKILARQDDCIA